MAYQTKKCDDRKYSFKLLYLSSDTNSLLWFLKMERIVRGNQGIPSIGPEEEPFDVVSFHSRYAPPPK